MALATSLALSVAACGDDGGVVDEPDATPAVAVWTSLTGEGALQPAFVYQANGDIYAVIGEVDKTVCKWNAVTGTWDPQTEPNANLAAEFIIDANDGIVATVGNSICRWNPATLAWDPVAPAAAGTTMSAAFAYVSDTEIWSIIDGMVQQWDGTAWTELTGPGNLRPAFVSSNGNIYAVIGDEGGDKTVCMWNAAAGTWDPQTTPSATLQPSFIIDAAGSIVATVGNSICRWNATTEVWDAVAPAPAGSVMSPAFTYTGDENIMAIIDGMVQRWAVPSV